jgi:regulator of protease activity HflC (stomatin/prohibitin superfamily)
MQNYAKFDSRIESSLMEQSNSFWWLSWQADRYYSWNIFDMFFQFIWNLIHFLSSLFVGLFFLFGFFFFVYIIVSLFTKWWEPTLQEVKKIWSWFSHILVNFTKFIFGKIQNIFSFLLKRKFIFISLFILILIIQFVGNIIDGTSKVLRLTKIWDSYVWVDLKNKNIIHPGYFLYSPITTNFFLSPTNNFDFEIAEVTANTSEELWVTLDYRVWFKLINEKRLEFYKEYWPKDIKIVSSDIVMPKLLETIKWIIKSYSYKDISSKHNEIKNITISEANKILKPLWIELQEINIVDIRLPETYLKSKQDLLNAENELKLAEARLETQKKESDKNLLEAQNLKSVKIIESEAIAESNKIINSQAITAEMLNMKKLEIEELKITKWNGMLPTSVWKEFDFLK